MSDNQAAQPDEAVIAARVEAAKAEVQAIINRKYAGSPCTAFRMCIPAQETDSDIVLSVALEGLDTLLAALTREREALAAMTARALAAEAALKQARDDVFDIGQIADSPDWLGFHESPPTDVIRDLGNRGYAIYEALCKVVPEAASVDNGGEAT